MLRSVNRLVEVIRGPEAVRWAGELYGSDTEFRLAVDDGVPPQIFESAAEHATSKAEFRGRVLDGYYDQL